MRHKFSRGILVSVLVLALAAPIGANAQGDGPTYVVEAGDTLSAIARRFGTTTEALILENDISDPSRIYPGTELTIPGFPGVSGRLTLLTVALGDTLESLSHAYRLDESALLHLNRTVRSDKLYAGMSLIVPVEGEGSVQQPAPYRYAARNGETPLEMGVRVGEAAWRGQIDDASPRLWLIPGEVYALGTQAEAQQGGLPEVVSALKLSPNPLVQGHTTEIQITANNTAQITGELGEHELAIFPTGTGEWVGLQGIHALADPGLVDFRLRFYQQGSVEPVYEFQQPILLTVGDYGFQTLNGVPPETVDPAVTEPEDAFIAELLSTASAEKYWQGPFEFPSHYYTAEFISTFGTRRSYNFGSLLYYHTGVDFYGQDEPVYAAAAGRVVFAGPLAVRGNATYIDHGWGVYSGYLHQSEMYVQEGDLVEAGQVIGKVGATGRVTGPHLHWEVWVGDVPVQPLEWISPGYPLPPSE